MNDNAAAAAAEEPAPTAAADAIPGAEARFKWPLEKPTGVFSEWWQYFGVYTLMRMVGAAVCRLCRTEVPRGDSSSTAGLTNHIKTCHSHLFVNGVLTLTPIDGSKALEHGA
jgi:BED zinc finger